jgi:hypothetical protein
LNVRIIALGVSEALCPHIIDGVVVVGHTLFPQLDLFVLHNDLIDFCIAAMAFKAFGGGGYGSGHKLFEFLGAGGWHDSVVSLQSNKGT